MHIFAYIKDITKLNPKLPAPSLIRYYPKSQTYRVGWEIVDYANNKHDKQKASDYLRDMKFLMQLSSNGNIIGFNAKYDKKFQKVHDNVYKIGDFDIYTKTQKFRLGRAMKKAANILEHVKSTGDKDNAVWNIARFITYEITRLNWHCEESILMVVKWAAAEVYGKDGVMRAFCKKKADELYIFAVAMREQIKGKDRLRKQEQKIREG
jgi:hypothetical protein